VTAVARWTVSAATGIPLDVQVAPPTGSLKIRFVKVAGGSILAAGLMLALSYWLSKKTQELHQRIINKKIKTFESEVEKTISANKGYIVHAAASGKPVYAIVSVTVYYTVTADTTAPMPPVQSIPDVRLDKVVMGTQKIEAPGKEYDTGRPPVTTYYQPFTFSVEVTAPAEAVEQYKAAMQEYKWYEDTLKNPNLLQADIERLTKEKELLKDLIQKSFY
jgi:hypothetical protein